jgi:hypothetical protein
MRIYLRQRTVVFRKRVIDHDYPVGEVVRY